MKELLSPNSVAIIGASNDETKLGGMLMKNMLNAGFKGKLYPINPKGGEIMGRKAYASVTDVGEPIDLAVVAVKAALVPGEIVKMKEAGIKYATILTAGFKEDSPEGAELEKELVKTAKECGVRFMGPNCFGLMSPGKGINATFAHLLPESGNITIFSQSGAVGSSIIDWAYHNKMGIADFITLGNKADMDEADFLMDISNDPNTQVIGMYCEGISDGERFVKAVEEMPVKKPIVIFKSGRTQAGSAAASSHTGSLAGSDAVNNVIFNKLNIFRAKDLDEMFDALAVFSRCGPMKKDGIAIITNAGGLGVMSADAAFDAPHINAVKFSDETIAEIKRRVPTVAGLTNPIDVRGDAKPEYFKEVIDIVTKDPNVGGLVIMGSPLDTADLESVAEIIVQIKDTIPVPTTVCFAGGYKCDRANAILKAGKMPTYPTPDRAVRALSILRKYTIRKEERHDPLNVPAISGRSVAESVIAKARSEGRGSLTEAEGKQIFAAYGIPTPGEALVRCAEDAASACDSIGYPVVMKIVSPDIQHKTDVGGVVVGVKNSAEAVDAYNRIMESCTKAAPKARIDGVSIQQMVSGQEVILSMIRDQQFGPVISFGLGGIYVEILREISQAHVPMTEQQLDEMIKSTKAYKLMSGARGLPEADIEAMKDVIKRMVLIAIENPEIHELEVNPVIVGLKGKGCWAVDALCTLVKE
ncbi:acetate--CoA ligase family protein [Candidatus Methanoprimaticola sp. MG2]|uniref:acetate--CoA ligase family protein n=1 Tax=Candidatus Methanoprimaticola sp. MG2 TaxID=3228838 RepID=UPI0039C7369B